MRRGTVSSVHYLVGTRFNLVFRVQTVFFLCLECLFFVPRGVKYQVRWLLFCLVLGWAEQHGETAFRTESGVKKRCLRKMSSAHAFF